MRTNWAIEEKIEMVQRKCVMVRELIGCGR